MNHPPQFNAALTLDPSGKVCVVVATGKLDMVAADEFEPLLEGQFRTGTRHFVFDLGGLEYIGSLGLQAFLRLANRVRGAGAVVLCDVAPPVRRLLELTKVTQVLKLYPSRADAIDAVRSL
ncbi:STAS domain-containing protein [Frigoriglobus tundricola]|uniref:Anti-sigma factor antagonist n=1 Tax=Frigoriglobus tundricola TaxID=2774151 RepID=A0A6M5Z348_9BACT|nr:STAS domain-containing protein [Frigoriglobus tundricola]QJW99632.1 hypothetical protein FTUN_7250 [Frigoriglobus tundricola]